MNTFIKVSASLALAVIPFLSPIVASAALWTAPAQVTFTFDITTDTLKNEILPIFSTRGVPAVLYAETGLLNGTEDWMLTWDDALALRDTHGWEIGNHSITHPNLTLLDDTALEQEVIASKNDFTLHGIDVTSYAVPFGIYDERVLRKIAQHFTSHRMAWGPGANQWPLTFNEYLIRSFEPTPTTTPSEVIAMIDQAIANHEWLVLLFHGVGDGSSDPHEYPLEWLEEIVAYTASSSASVVTMTEGVTIGAPTGLIQNSSFEDADVENWATWWNRSSVTSVSRDTTSKGSAPYPLSSVLISSSSTKQSISTPLITIEDTMAYDLSMYQDTVPYTSGEWAVWVDEFDGGGLWQSGKILGIDIGNYVGKRHYPYIPTSAAVSSAVFTIFVVEDSVLDLRVDSVDLRVLGPILPPDTTGPVITLNGSSTIDLLVGDAYVELGATATDNVDPSVTVLTSGTVNTAATGTYQILYNATDVAGNPATQVVRTISVSAVPVVVNQAPTITILGSNPLSLTVGNTYVEAGATSTDPEDGDITTKITTSGSVNTAVVGTYFIVYNATDTQSLLATATRTVSVIAAPVTPPPSSGGGGGGGGGSIYYYNDLKINGGALQSSSTNVTLTLAISGLPQMWIANDASFSSGSWIPFKTTYPWTLTSATGTKTVYVRFGSASSTYATSQASIVLTVPGTGTSTPVVVPPTSSTGTVLGASTTVPCSPLLAKTLRFGNRGDEVKKLQTFLNLQGEKLPVTGYFGPMTREAVKRFQTKFASIILAPLGLKNPTGLVGPATIAQVNALACGGN